MTLEQIKRELAAMPGEQLDHLVAFLVHLRYERDSEAKAELTRRIDDPDPSHWVSIEQLREHWKD